MSIQCSDIGSQKSVPQIRPLADIVHFKYSHTYLLTCLPKLSKIMHTADYEWIGIKQQYFFVSEQNFTRFFSFNRRNAVVHPVLFQFMTSIQTSEIFAVKVRSSRKSH